MKTLVKIKKGFGKWFSGEIRKFNKTHPKWGTLWELALKGELPEEEKLMALIQEANKEVYE